MYTNKTVLDLIIHSSVLYKKLEQRWNEIFQSNILLQEMIVMCHKRYFERTTANID